MSFERSGNGDPPAGQLHNVVDEKPFRFILNLEVNKAVRLQYCNSVMCLTPDRPPPRANSLLMKRIAETAVRGLRDTDLVTTLPRFSIGILLVDAEPAALPGILDRLKEELDARRLTVKGREWRVSWSAGGGCYPLTATSGGDLLRQAIDLMTRAKQEGGARLKLPS